MLIGIFSAFLVMVAIAVYLIRDLPRRLLETELGRQLNATVSLDGWKMAGQDSWELHGLKVKPHHLPVGMVLEAPVVRIQGRAEDIADGKLRSLLFESSILRLELPRADGASSPETEQTSQSPLIDDLRIPGMSIVLCAELVGFACKEPVNDSPLELDAHFREIGRQAQGRLDLVAQDLDLVTTGAEPESPQIHSELKGLRLSAELDRGVWTLGADAEELRVSTSTTDLHLAAISWTGIADVAHGLTPITRNASLGSGRLSSGEQSVQLPEVRWRAMDAADPPGSTAGGSSLPLRLAMESELWESGLITLDSQGQESSLALDVTGMELGSLLRRITVSPTQTASPLQSTPQIEGRADLSLQLAQSPEQPLAWVLDLEVSPRVLNLETPEPLNLQFATGTSIRLGGRGQGLPGDSLSAVIEGTVQLPGVMSAQSGVAPLDSIPNDAWPIGLDWRAELGTEQLRLEHWNLRSRLATCSGSGELALGSPDPKGTGKWQCSGKLVPALAAFAPTLPRPSGSDAWKARGQARWQGPDWATDGRLELSADSLSPADGVSVADLSLKSRFRMNPKRLHLSETDLTLAVAGPGPSPLRGHAKGEVTVSLDAPMERLRWDVQSVELAPGSDGVEQPPLGVLRTKGESRPGRLDATVHLESPSPAPWLEWLGPWLPQEIRTLDTKGELSFEGQLSQDQNSYSLTGPWLGRGLGFATEDGSRVIEGLDVDSQLSARWSTTEAVGQKLDIELEGQAGGFLMLWKTLFSDFSDLSTGFTLGADMQVAEISEITSAPITIAAVLQPSQGPRLDLSGSIRPEDRSGNFDLHLDARDLKSLHSHFLVRLQDDPPTLSALDGAAALELQGSFQNTAGGLEGDVRGLLQLERARVTTESMDLQGMDLNLPIDLRMSRSGGDIVWSGGQRQGSFRLGRSTVGELQLPVIESELDVRADSVILSRPLEINLLGGTVEMTKLTLRDLAQPGRFAETALSMRGLSLAKITANSGLPVLEGQLNGELPKVSIAGQVLKVSGGGTLQLLGGEVAIRDISGSEIFTPFPELRLSADIRRLSLERLTETFDFGRVTGLISGQIDDCELFRGVPTAFRASFHTVPEQGVKQTVDVKAVKNLTILGTGQGTNIFDQGIQRFLSSYRYSALGVDVTLRNDVLLLKGLERRGEKELFLKGGFPFGIDIVNARPGQTVSFQTMVGRLKSLDFDRATFGGK